MNIYRPVPSFWPDFHLGNHINDLDSFGRVNIDQHNNKERYLRNKNKNKVSFMNKVINSLTHTNECRNTGYQLANGCSLDLFPSLPEIDFNIETAEESMSNSFEITLDNYATALNKTIKEASH